MINEFELWDAFRLGNENSFKTIFEHYNGLLFNYGHKFTTDDNIIEDSVQELFVKLWYNRNSIGDTPSVKNYLYKAYRRILSRKLARSNRMFSIGVVKDEDLPFDISLPHDLDLIHKERLDEIRKQLNSALSKMSPRQREVIHLRYYEEMSYEEVADVMGLSVKDTYKLTYRAIDSLRDHISAFNLMALFVLLSNLR